MAASKKDKHESTLRIKTESTPDITHKVSLEELDEIIAQKNPHRALRKDVTKTRFSRIFTSPLFEKRHDLDAFLKEQMKRKAKNFPFSLRLVPGKLANMIEIERCYTIKRDFSEGGQGILSIAREMSLERDVAMKSLKKELLDNIPARHNFMTEAQITAQLDHPAIVPIYSLTRDEDNGIHLAMKFIKGQTLTEYIEQIVIHYKAEGIRNFDVKKGLDFRLGVFLRVCDAIAYAHSRNIIHCDLKPENIMIGEYNETYVMDWGIAKQIYEPDGHTLTKESRTVIDGTPRYMPPEALIGLGRDERSDIFALGSILFEISTLRQAFSGESSNEVLKNIRNNHRNPIRSNFNFKIHKDLKAIINKAMSYDRDERYQSVDLLAEDVRNFLAGEEVMANPDYFWNRFARWSLIHIREVFIFIFFLLSALLFLQVKTSVNQMYKTVRTQERNVAASLAYNNIAETAISVDRRLGNMENILEHFSESIALLLRGSSLRPARQGTIPFYNDLLREDADFKTEFSIYYTQDISVDSFVYCSPDGPISVNRLNDLQKLFPLQDDIYKLLARSKHFQPSRSNFQFLSSATKELLRTELLSDGLPIMWCHFTFVDGVHISFPGSSSFTADFDARNLDWYKAALESEGAVFWNSPYAEPLTGEPVITCAKAVFDSNGNLRGVAGLDIALNKLRNIMQTTGNRSTAVVGKALVGDDGKILICTNIARKRMENFTISSGLNCAKVPNHLYLDMKWQNFGTKICSEDDLEFLYAYSKVPSINCYYLEKIWLRPWLQEIKTSKKRHRSSSPIPPK